MIELVTLKARTNLLALISLDTDLKRIASTGGGEYAGPCPFCGGRDRFQVAQGRDIDPAASGNRQNGFSRFKFIRFSIQVNCVVCVHRVPFSNAFAIPVKILIRSVSTPICFFI